MPTTLDDVLRKLDENEDRIRDEVRGTSEKLGDRLRNVEVEVSGLSATVRGQGREVGDLKTALRDHINREPTGAVPLPSAPTSSHPRTSVSPTVRIDKKLFDALKFYAALGAFLTGVVLTLVNLLGYL